MEHAPSNRPRTARPNDSPYSIAYESITELGEYFEYAHVSDKRVLVGNQYFDVDSQEAFEVKDVVQKQRRDHTGQLQSRGGVFLVVESDHPERPQPYRIEGEAFSERLDTEQYIPFDANGWLPRELRL